MENEFTVQDLISLSYEQKPLEFQQAFDTIIGDRIAAAVNDKKVEVAASLYAPEDVETNIEFDTEQETDTDPEVQDQEEDTDGEAA